MIVLFTDFGLGGPYIGQVRAVLRRAAPDADIINLFADAPAHDPKAAAYLLAAYVPDFSPKNSVESDYLLQTNSYRKFREATKYRVFFRSGPFFVRRREGLHGFGEPLQGAPRRPPVFPVLQHIDDRLVG